MAERLRLIFDGASCVIAARTEPMSYMIIAVVLMAFIVAAIAPLWNALRGK